MDNLVLIKEYTVSQRGERNLIVSLPKLWLKTQNIRQGDKVQFLQSADSDDIIIRKSTNKVKG